MASFPNSNRSFTSKVDITDTIYADHVNALQDEVIALETKINGADASAVSNILFSTYTGGFVASLSWDSLFARLNNIETGLVNGWATSPFIRKVGGDAIQPPSGTTGITLKTTAGTTDLFVTKNASNTTGFKVDSNAMPKVGTANVFYVGSTEYTAMYDYMQSIQTIQGTQGLQGTQGIQGTQGTGYSGVSSTTSARPASTGTITITTNRQGSFVTGDRVRVTNSVSNYFEGTVTITSGTTFAVAADYNLGTTTASSWTISTAGVRGVQGTTGTTGSQGATGTQGATGGTGAQGTSGTQGTTGAQGIAGAAAAQGATGSQGATGPQGATGTGVQGTTGAQGTTGTQGSTGTTGSQGTTGTQGTSGLSLQTSNNTWTGTNNFSNTITANSVVDGTTSTAASGIGFMGIPQNSTTTGSYTIAAADAGKHIYSTATRTITINSNANLALPIGTAITFIASAGTTVTIAITTDTMYLAGTGTTGSRSLAAYGMATAIKITSTTWIISGNGLT